MEKDDTTKEIMKMRIDITDRKSIMVELSKDDLSKSEITYDQLDYSNPKTRKLVRSILEKIRSETGLFSSEYSSLEVEVMPDSFGGCLMIFKEGDNAEVKESEDALFVCENINDLIDCSRTADKTFDSVPDGKLYKSSSVYYLFIPACPSVILSFIGEYLSRCSLSKSAREAVLEQSVCLAESGALSLLSGKKL